MISRPRWLAPTSLALSVVGLLVSAYLTFEHYTGNETLAGTSGNDLMDGGAGKDKMAGGLGDDTYIVDNKGDKVTEFAGQGIDTVQTSLASYKLPNNVENLIYTGTGSFKGTGNASDNVITGGSGNDNESA